MGLYFSVQDSPAQTVYRLQGRWTVATLPEIEKEVTAELSPALKKLVFNGADLNDLDTSAAWYLDAFIRNLKQKNISVEVKSFNDNHRRIFERVARLPHAPDEPQQPAPSLRTTLAAVGKKLTETAHDCYQGITFFGEFLAILLARILRPKHLRFQSIVFHVNETGIKAAPIISLMAFSIAFVMGYQGAFQLQKFDATIYTVDLVVLSILREMGVLIAAIMVAGRSGSAFAAQIGTMKLNEEVDALQTMGVSPFEVLVLPRIIGIMIALPLLTVIADLMGLLGGYIFSSSYLGYSYVQFLSRMQEVADMQQFYVGVSKAPVFAILIGIVGCMQGLQARSSAEDVGRKTVTAVVQSIFLVIVADALFSVIFTRLGI